jgi:hypothetical protein
VPGHLEAGIGLDRPVRVEVVAGVEPVVDVDVEVVAVLAEEQAAAGPAEQAVGEQVVGSLSSVTRRLSGLLQ